MKPFFHICKSVEYNSVGVMGPYRMGVPLRVVFELQI
ncbi:hypothetical protein PDIG_61210 [Penicillium digitatum PHI26]|uniref:Uncharacterized protein n=2 Tax=Penicillium digitatum TaxID=36651 RepID=K9G8F7_PEND2|nr:hypothetical protein PDIP_70640 [Penicillium digitatum Pd1]EKV07888.1 hypothetical protein PDIP_70640 [Penicillium digitatum Pd1]EKV09511.1 hypothetical protein PDIG_61210 [Penicillium digitatum PHI26]